MTKFNGTTKSNGFKSIWAIGLAAAIAVTSTVALAREYEIVTDRWGKRMLLDIETGLIVGPVDGPRARRILRQAKRAERGGSLLDRLLDRFDDSAISDDRPRRQARRERERGFFLDERDRRRAAREERARERDVARETLEPAQPRASDGGGNLAPPVRSAPLDGDLDGNVDTALNAPATEAAPPEPVRREPSQPTRKLTGSQVARLQIALDREGFSPGEIDGRMGSNVRKAVDAWNGKNGGDLYDPAAVDAIIERSGPAFRDHVITDAEANYGYIASVPVDYAEKAQLSELAYTSPEEHFAELFHISKDYLRQLNPNADLRRAGTVLKVPAVGERVQTKVHYIVADKAREQVRAYDRNGTIVAAYPATIGSSSTPSPSGIVQVTRIAFDPGYTYNPKINFTQGDNTEILEIPSGPNGPVGNVWIALSKKTYGIHGTPEPSTIGKTNSHGCIRLTNWDAQELAKLVKADVTVEFLD